MRHLIDAVIQNPVAALRDQSPAADDLVAIGVSALPLIREVLDGRWSGEAHPVDVLEAFSYIAGRIRANAVAASSPAAGSA